MKAFNTSLLLSGECTGSLESSGNLGNGFPLIKTHIGNRSESRSISFYFL